MSTLITLIGITGALAIGAISPGPSFVMIARTAAASGRNAGMAAAYGMGFGGMVFSVAALVGLQSLLLAVPALYMLLKLCGGLYLVYMGVRIWRGARTPLAMDVGATGRNSVRRSFGLAFATQVSNPKTAIVYASVFAAFLHEPVTFQLGFAIVAVAFVLECGWYSLVALVLSSEGPRASYLRYKQWVDRTAGGVMVALGLKLAYSSHD